MKIRVLWAMFQVKRTLVSHAGDIYQSLDSMHNLILVAYNAIILTQPTACLTVSVYFQFGCQRSVDGPYSKGFRSRDLMMRKYSVGRIF